MPIFQLWKPSENFEAAEILVPHAYRSELASFIKQGLDSYEIGVTPRFYWVSELGLSQIEVVKLIIFRSQYSSDLTELRFDIPFELLEGVNYLKRYFEGFEYFNAKFHGVESIFESQYFTSYMLTRLCLLRDLSEDIIFGVLDRSPFVKKDFKFDNKAWWDLGDSLSQPVRRLMKRIKVDFSGEVPTPFDRVLLWLQELESNLRSFQRSSVNWSQENVIRHTSGYFWFLAERQLLLGNSNLALIFMHRSVDLLLFAICADNRLIDFAKDKGFGKYRDDDKDAVTLLNSLNRLGGVISANSSRDDLFKELNNWRNQTMYAHALTSIEYGSALKLYYDLLGSVENLGGSGWNRMRRFLRSFPELELCECLGINDESGSFYQPFSINDVLA